MANIILAAVALACAIGWLKRWAVSEMLIRLFEYRGYPKPTEEEIERCANRMAKRIFKKDF